MENFDLVVAGAGLAGLETARRVAERGLGLLSIESRRSINPFIPRDMVRRTLEISPEYTSARLCETSLYILPPAEHGLASPYDELCVGRMGLLAR